MRPRESLEHAGRVLFWPQVLFAEDLAEAFRISRATARRWLARGDFGPRFRSGRRWAVRKEALLTFLAEREALPTTEPALLHLRGGEERR